MNTKLRIDNILFEYIYYTLKFSVDETQNKLREDLVSMDCQDTENDHNVECYFYFPNDINDTTFRKYGKCLHQLLKVDDNYNWLVEVNDDFDCKWKRLEIIVEFK